MANIQAPLKYTVDLDQGAVQAILEKPLATLDSLAHVFSVSVTQGSTSVDLTGATCTGYFIRSDKVTIPIDGTVSGNVASVTLLPNCYAVSGRFFLHVKLTSGSVVHSILRVEGSVQTSRTDAMAPGGGAVQSFDQLVETAAHCSRAYNLLDNSDFRNPIAQAGYNGKHGTRKYVCDRWISWNVDAVFENGYMTVGSPYDQSIEPAKIDTAKTYTAAVGLADGQIIVYSGNFASGFGFKASGIFGGLSSDNITPFVRIASGQNVRWAALYEGEYTADTLPTYQPKGYAAELAECMRHYQRYPYFCYALSQWGFYQGYMNFIIPMRISPSITLCAYATGTKGSFTDVSADNADVSGAQVNNTSQYGFRAQNSGQLVKDHAYHFIVEASADL